MSAISTEPRPQTLTAEEIKKASGSKKDEPWQSKGELWKYKIIDKIIDEISGMCGNTTEDFQKYYAQVYGQQLAGLECDEEIAMLREYARISGDIQGKNKVQIVQIVEDKAAVFPSAGGLYPAEVPKVGLIRGIINKITGVKEDGSPN